MNVCLILALWFSLAFGNVDLRIHEARQTASKPTSAPLIVEARITDEKYIVENNSSMWRWSLILTYKNMGLEPILLYKKSSLIYRSMTSRSAKAAFRGRYEEQTYSHFFSADALGASGFLNRRPEEADFVTLKPGESYSVEAEYGMETTEAARRGRRAHRGKRFIQLRVATWYFYVDPEEYRQKWRNKGYLWSQNVTSQPMAFTLK